MWGNGIVYSLSDFFRRFPNFSACKGVFVLETREFETQIQVELVTEKKCDFEFISKLSTIIYLLKF